MDHVNASIAADQLSRSIREAIEGNLVGRAASPEEVRSAVHFALLNAQQSGLIAPVPGSVKVGEIHQLWSGWTIGQKARWWFYNRVPIVRDLSRRLREALEDQNDVAIRANFLLEEHADDHEDEPFSTVSIPYWLTADPKTIYVSDVEVKLAQSIDFISVNVTVNPEAK